MVLRCSLTDMPTTSLVQSIPVRRRKQYFGPETNFSELVLRRIYGDEAVDSHNYSTTLSSVAFAGTIVGMLVFGVLSDHIGILLQFMRESCPDEFDRS